MKCKIPSIALLTGWICLIAFPYALAKGFELYGRVYDGNAKDNSINDADLDIKITGIEPSITYPTNQNGSYRAIEFDSVGEKTVSIRRTTP